MQPLECWVLGTEELSGHQQAYPWERPAKEFVAISGGARPRLPAWLSTGLGSDRLG
jgi:hypothetical protein